jgi:hypothetical protein
MSVELSKQKLDIDEAARAIHAHIIKLQEMEKVLLAGIKMLDEGQDMLYSGRLLASDVRDIMRDLSMGKVIPK